MTIFVGSGAEHRSLGQKFIVEFESGCGTDINKGNGSKKCKQRAPNKIIWLSKSGGMHIYSEKRQTRNHYDNGKKF